MKPAKTAIQKGLSQPLTIMLALVLVGGSLWFFTPYLGVICLSAIMAYLFLPVYRWLARRIPPALASWTTLLISALIVIIPLTYVGITVVKQSIIAIDAISHLDTSPGSPLANTITSMSDIGHKLGLPIETSDVASPDSIINFIKVTIPNIVKIIANAILQIAINAPAFFTSLLIYALLFTAILGYHKQLHQFILDISPLDKETTLLYIRRSGVIVTASMRGQFIISFVTAVLCAALLSLVGYSPYFLLLVTVFTVLGMIPLGSGILVIPMLLLGMLVGDFWANFWALMFYLVVICNLDSILRPRLIPKEAELVPVLTILATFCGLYYFGIMGVVYGPLIVILLSTTTSVLIANNQLLRSKT